MSCPKSQFYITKLVEYRYNSVEIDVQLCTQFFTFRLKHPGPTTLTKIFGDCSRHYSDLKVLPQSTYSSGSFRKKFSKNFLSFLTSFLTKNCML